MRTSSLILLFSIQKIHILAVRSLLSVYILELCYLVLPELTVIISPKVLIGLWKVKCMSNTTKYCKRKQVHNKENRTESSTPRVLI